MRISIFKFYKNRLLRKAFDQYYSDIAVIRVEIEHRKIARFRNLLSIFEWDQILNAKLLSRNSYARENL